MGWRMTPQELSWSLVVAQRAGIILPTSESAVMKAPSLRSLQGELHLGGIKLQDQGMGGGGIAKVFLPAIEGGADELSGDFGFFAGEFAVDEEDAVGDVGDGVGGGGPDVLSRYLETMNLNQVEPG